MSTYNETVYTTYVFIRHRLTKLQKKIAKKKKAKEKYCKNNK